MHCRSRRILGRVEKFGALPLQVSLFPRKQQEPSPSCQLLKEGRHMPQMTIKAAAVGGQPSLPLGSRSALACRALLCFLAACSPEI